MKYLLPTLTILATLITSCSSLTGGNSATTFTNTSNAENNQHETLNLHIPTANNNKFPAVADSLNAYTEYIRKSLKPQPGDTLGMFEAYLTWKANANNEVTQLTLQSYLFTGGAHGITTVSAVLFDNATAKRITPRELFADTTRFLQFVADHITADSIPLFAQFNRQLPMPETLMLDSVSITALYNQYEIAPYSSGIIQVSVPYKNLGDTFDTTAIKPSTLKEIKCPVE